LEGKGVQSGEEMVCARTFWPLSNPREMPFVLLLMERVQSRTYMVILCLAQERQETPLFFYAETHSAVKTGCISRARSWWGWCRLYLECLKDCPREKSNG